MGVVVRRATCSFLRNVHLSLHIYNLISITHHNQDNMISLYLIKSDTQWWAKQKGPVVLLWLFTQIKHYIPHIKGPMKSYGCMVNVTQYSLGNMGWIFFCKAICNILYIGTAHYSAAVVFQKRVTEVEMINSAMTAHMCSSHRQGGHSAFLFWESHTISTGLFPR